MGRCSGCSGDRCSCIIRAGSGASVTGAGTQANPYVISASGGEGGSGGRIPGEIIAFGGSVAPAGWLVANGQSVSRAAYSALFSAIGTVYGAGDGATTFNLPDLAGRFPLGADAGHAVGDVSGNETIILTTAQLPSHTHTINHQHAAANTGGQSQNHTHSGGTDVQGQHQHIYEYPDTLRSTYAGGGSLTAWNSWRDAGLTGAAGAHSHGVWTNGANVDHTHVFQTPTFNGNSGSTGSGSAVNIMPPWTGVTYLIKT